jgi:hypothetical protein
LGYFFPWRTTYFQLNSIVLKVISFILVIFRCLKKILTEVLLYWSIQLLLLDSLSSMQVKPSLTVMHLPYLVKLDGTTPSCIFAWYLCIPVFSSNTSCRYFNVSSLCDSLQCSIILCKGLSCIPQ